MIEFFQALMKYRGILYYRTLASLRADARGMYLGYLWWFLEPVLNTALYYLIFGVLLGSKTPDFIAYLLTGTIIFNWFQTGVMSSLGTIVARAHLYRQIPLPKYLFGLIGIFSSTWRFCCVFVVILAYISISTEIVLGWNLLWLPILIAILLLLVFGLSIVLSIASAYIEDLKTFIGVVFRALMFLSAIFWNVSKVPPHLEVYFYSNPIASLIQAFRSVVLYNTAPNLTHLIYVTLLALSLIQIGVFWHRRIDGHILKHIKA